MRNKFQRYEFSRDSREARSAGIIAAIVEFEPLLPWRRGSRTIPALEDERPPKVLLELTQASGLPYLFAVAFRTNDLSSPSHCQISQSNVRPFLKIDNLALKLPYSLRAFRFRSKTMSRRWDPAIFSHELDVVDWTEQETVYHLLVSIVATHDILADGMNGGRGRTPLITRYRCLSSCYTVAGGTE